MQQHSLVSPALSVLVRHRRRILVIVALALLLDICNNVYSHRVNHPANALDKPFHTGCQQPETSAPRENATILMLARNSDIEEAVSSLQSLEAQFNKWFHYPIVFLNDQDWAQAFKDAVVDVVSGPVQFGVIDQRMWQYPDWIDRGKARKFMDIQEQSGVLYGGNESYHHMCRFNSG